MVMGPYYAEHKRVFAENMSGDGPAQPFPIRPEEPQMPTIWVVLLVALVFAWALHWAFRWVSRNRGRIGELLRQQGEYRNNDERASRAVSRDWTTRTILRRRWPTILTTALVASSITVNLVEVEVARQMNESSTSILTYSVDMNPEVRVAAFLAFLPLAFVLVWVLSNWAPARATNRALTSLVIMTAAVVGRYGGAALACLALVLTGWTFWLFAGLDAFWKTQEEIVEDLAMGLLLPVDPVLFAVGTPTLLVATIAKKTGSKLAAVCFWTTSVLLVLSVTRIGTFVSVMVAGLAHGVPDS